MLDGWRKIDRGLYESPDGQWRITNPWKLTTRLLQRVGRDSNATAPAPCTPSEPAWSVASPPSQPQSHSTTDSGWPPTHAHRLLR
jgi:hypothetical protein